MSKPNEPKGDLSQLNNGNVTNSYIAEVEKLLLTHHGTAPSTESLITKAMEEAASLTIPKEEKAKQCKHEIFKDDHMINDLIERRSKAKENSDEKKNLNKALKKRVRELRTEKLKKRQMSLHYMRLEKTPKKCSKNSSMITMHIKVINQTKHVILQSLKTISKNTFSYQTDWSCQMKYDKCQNT